MKRFILLMAILSSIFLMLIVSIRQSTVYHQTKAREYMSQGFYDEAMQEFSKTASHIRILETSINLFGKMNALLAALGILFFSTHFILKKPQTHVPKVKITQEFQ